MAKSVKDRAMEMGFKAMGKLMEDPKRAEAISKLFVRAQEGKQAVDAAQERILAAAGLASRADFKTMGKRISVMNRRARALDEKLTSLAQKWRATGH